MNDEENNATFWQHLDELRFVLIKILAIILCMFCMLLFFYDDLFLFFERPLHQLDGSLFNFSSSSFLPGSLHPLPLVILSPIEGMSLAFKICFWTSFATTSPLWLAVIFHYLSPALFHSEKKLLLFFMGWSVFMLCCGFCFAYFITIPIANSLLANFNSSIGLNLWTLSSYLDYTLFLLLANGLAFESSVVLFACVQLGILSAAFMKRYRRHAIVMAFVMGALFTPPDVPTQLMLAFPLIIIYEAAHLYACFLEKKRKSLKLYKEITI